jgi:hypothetical protein
MYSNNTPVYVCEGGNGSIPPIQTVQNASDNLGLSDSASVAGSVYSRSADSSLALFDDYSDFYTENVSDLIPIVDEAVGNIDKVISLSDILSFSQLTNVSGGRFLLDAGSSEPSWIDLTTGWSSEPTVIASIPSGQVLSYKYNFDSVTYYRLVPNSGLGDAFYSSFDGSTLSGLIKVKEITV